MSYTSLSHNKSAGDVRWHWRIASICASSLILGGFLVLPSTFDTEARLRTSQAAVGIFGIALLAVGFTLTAVVSFGCRSWTFALDNVFVPAAVSSLVGLLTVPYCFIVSTRFEWNLPALLTTIGSAVCAAVYAALYFFVRRQTARTQTPPDRIDLMQRPPSITSTANSYHTQGYFANHVANMYPAARAAPSILATPPEEEPLNEEELTRKHMSSLLYRPEESHTSRAASPFNRIDFQVDDTESDPPLHGYYAPSNIASGPHPLDNQSWRNRNHSWGNDSRRTSGSREERRREIEMGRLS